MGNLNQNKQQNQPTMRNYIALAAIATAASAISLRQGIDEASDLNLYAQNVDQRTADKKADKQAERKQARKDARKAARVDARKAARQEAKAEAKAEEEECRGFDDLREGMEQFWWNFINEGYLGLMAKEEGWKDPCDLPEDWTLEDVPEEFRDDVAELDDEELAWIRDLCKKPKGDGERVVGLQIINDFTEEEIEASMEKGTGEVEALYNMISAPIIDQYEAAVDGLLDECTAVEEFEKAFEQFASGAPPAEAGGEEGEDVIGELEQTAEAVGVQGGFQAWD